MWMFPLTDTENLDIAYAGSLVHLQLQIAFETGFS